VYTLSSIEHFPRPQCALEEMVRAVKPGGRIYVADYDYRTMMIDSDIPDVTQRIVAYFAEVDTNSEFVFTVPRRLGDMGLRAIRVEALVELVSAESFAAAPDFGYAFYRQLWLSAMAADAEAAGAVTAEEARCWLDELDER
jgi:SAM-dependent methyltransferase